MAREPDTIEWRQDADVVPLRTLVARWWIVLVVAIVSGALLGSAVIGSKEAIFEIEVEVLVGPVLADADVLEGAADLARTYGEVVESRRVVERAVAASGADVEPEDVLVAAEAGRGSATLTIVVQAPTQSGTPAIAAAVTDALEDVVRDSRRGAVVVTTGGADDPDDDPAPVLSGSTVVVIDDGGGEAVRQSLGPATAGAVGALAAVLLATAIALGLETRRRVGPPSEMLIEYVGADLGRLHVRPTLPGRLGTGQIRVLTADERALHDATLTAETVVRRSSPDEGEVIFVGSPSAHHDYVRAVLQLTAAVEGPTIVLDPTRVIAETIAPGHPVEAGRLQRLVVDGVSIGDLLVPRHEEVRADSPAPIPAELIDEGVVVLVFAPVSHRLSQWRVWARTADEAAVLVAGRHRRKAALTELVSRLHSVGLEIRGGISVQRRWSRSSSPISIETAGNDPDVLHGHHDNPSDLVHT